MAQKSKPPKRIKPDKEKTKTWLKKMGHGSSAEIEFVDALELVAIAHNVEIEKLRNMVKL